MQVATRGVSAEFVCLLSSVIMLLNGHQRLRARLGERRRVQEVVSPQIGSNGFQVDPIQCVPLLDVSHPLL
jgi:hypothetical protein